MSRAAGAVIFEVRRQFREHPGIMAGTEKPEYGKVVDIVHARLAARARHAGLLAVLTPIAVGFGLGVGALGSYLAGTIATGTLMAVFLSNSGGAWDNAKKFVEDGNFGGKGSEAHAATVIGDTVGDPFKDTAGPAINPLHQGDEPGVAADRPGDRDAVPRRADHRCASLIALVAVVIVVASVVISKRRPIAVGDVPVEVVADLSRRMNAGDGAPTLGRDDVRLLRDDLRAAGYTVDGVLELLGPAAYAGARPG